MADLQRLARVLDAAVRIPGTNIRFGLDPILGLVPGFGDVAGGALSGYIILAAWRQGAPASVLGRMLINVATDTLLGSIPLLGDAFDVAWKANQRNVRLLETYLAQPTRAKRASRLVIAAVIAGLVLLVIGSIALAVAVIRAIVGLF